VSPATVSRVLRRLGLNRIRDLEPAEPERRYERESPGEIIHIDIKKLGRFERVGHRLTGDPSGPNRSRGAGWDFVHVCIDDHSRVAFSEIKPDETADSAISFLKAAVAYYKSLGVTHARHDRQWQLLPVLRLPRRLPGPGHQAYPHQALHAQNKRKGRALHSDRASGMGLCQGLPNIRSPRSTAAGLAASIQLALTPWWYKLANAHQQTRPNRGQPLEAPHLVDLIRHSIRPRWRFTHIALGEVRDPAARRDRGLA
jgi:hypothetical protein